MALFCAGACAFFFVLGTAVVANYLQEKPDLTPVIVAILTILFGCILSSVLGWIGIAIALRNGVRIFVRSNLYRVCHGQFAMAQTLEAGRIRTNPANYIIVVVTAVPLLAIWFMGMLTTVPTQGNKQDETQALVLLGLLPVLAIVCIAVVAFLSTRITARSPIECWGADIPEHDEDAANWYRWTE